MMGQHDGQKEFFSYQVDLDRRIRADHPLRAIRTRIDFRFVRDEVAHCYGHNGNVSTDPEVILKLMFLLFLDNVKSERELMRMVSSPVANPAATIPPPAMATGTDATKTTVFPTALHEMSAGVTGVPPGLNGVFHPPETDLPKGSVNLTGLLFAYAKTI